MRTTVRLPDELYTQVRLRAVAEGATVTAFIEEALRHALNRREPSPAPALYRVAPFSGDGVQRGVDLDDNAALLDVMDVDARP